MLPMVAETDHSAMIDPADFPTPTRISVNGLELEVFEAGRQNAGKPTVLCHGWPAHAFPGALARAGTPLGEPIMIDSVLDVLVSVESSGFTISINWYRNFDRNWQLLAEVNPIIQQPTLMIYGDRDAVPRSENLKMFVPNVEVVNLDCGHWIQQERPDEATLTILKWLERQDAT